MTTAVRTCAASACAFNAETSCNALAITVAGTDRTPTQKGQMRRRSAVPAS